MNDISEVMIYRAIMRVLQEGHLCAAGPDLDTIPCPLMHPWVFEFRVPEKEDEMQRRSDFARQVIVAVNRQRRQPST